MDGATVVAEGAGVRRLLLVEFVCCAGGCPNRRRLRV